MNDGPSTSEVLPRSERSMLCIMTTSTKRWAIVVGDCLLRRTVDPQTDLPLREACCMPGAWVKDITRKLPRLIWPSDYYPLLLFHVGGNEATTHSPRVIKRDFRALGWWVRESAAQVIFSSILPVAGSDIGRNRWAQSNNTWLHGWCGHHSFVFFDNGVAYTAPGLLMSDVVQLSQTGKRVFAHKLVGLIDRALN